MSDDQQSRAERTAKLADQLLRSAKTDGLDETKLSALGERMFEGKAASSAKMPFSAILVLGGLATMGGALFYARGQVHEDHPVAVVQPIASTPTANESFEPPVAAPPPATVDVGLLPDAPPAKGPQLRTEPTPAPLADDLSAELLALEQVHRAIAENHAADARAALSEYERSFPKKRLAQEARVLEIEVLLAEGRHSEAEARAQVFLAGSGAEGPYAARVRSLIARPRTR